MAKKQKPYHYENGLLNEIRKSAAKKDPKIIALAKSTAKEFSKNPVSKSIVAKLSKKAFNRIIESN